MSYGARLAQARHAAGLTQQQVADRIGMSHDHIRALELGHYQPNPASTEALGTLLNVWPRAVLLERLAREVKTARMTGRMEPVWNALEALGDQPPTEERRCLNCGTLIGLVAYSAVYCSVACADEHKEGRARTREGT